MMRTHRSAAIWAGLSVLALAPALAAPAPAAAAPHHDRGLTIAATPDPIAAGQGVLIYGQLRGPDHARRRIYLFHRINPASHFTVIGVRRTDAQGFFEFVRADGVVVSNRNWFVTGPGFRHSRTVHELVSSVVTLSTPGTDVTTAERVHMTGTVFPAHPHQRVLLQQQNSSTGAAWRTIASTYTRRDSGFAFSHRFRTPGAYTLRAYFPADRRNLAGASAQISLAVQQQQNPSFTIAASAPVIANGQTDTISGTLYAAGSTTTTQPNVPVTLYGKRIGGAFKAIESGMTDASGNYSFTQMPMRNTVYRVQTGAAPVERSASLYVGVQDVVTAALSSPTTGVGAAVTLSGTVTPEHGGHVIHLQQQNAQGDWVNVRAGYVSPGSTYSFTYTPGQTGTVQLRVEITGGPVNVGAVSVPVTLTVSGAAPVSTLPPAS